LVDDIAATAKLEAEGDAIFMMQGEITYLNDLSLEGDIPNDASDITEVRKKALFGGS
jgi:hypothetical protein